MEVEGIEDISSQINYKKSSFCNLMHRHAMSVIESLKKFSNVILFWFQSLLVMC